INVDILRSSFLPLFLATTVAAGLLAAAGALRWGEPGSLAMLAGGTLYLLGMFGVTMLFNVPLNDALTAAGDGGGSAEIWARYVREWT
ncbi:anthrone oxygenase family protein, partial [Acinetobacter pittii]|uniref:anthrone oxygenase family protein n=3 Tax=Pseudomonadota TaxID=1224 RepID=UPI0013D73F93